MTTKQITKKEAIENILEDWRNSPTRLNKRTRVYKDASIYFSDAQIKAAIGKHYARRMRKREMATIERSVVTHKQRVDFLNFIKRFDIKYNPTAYSSRYNSTGVDWVKYHRASSNGKGWVCIAPDEPGNNVYIEDEIMVRFMTKRYIK